MKAKKFDRFWKHERKHLKTCLKSLKSQIDDDIRQEPEDLPSIQITISINEACDNWSIQTGDNSYSGSCYGDPYWGVSYLYRRSNTDQLSKDLIEDLASVITFED